jgi:hypothetical protein
MGYATNPSAVATAGCYEDDMNEFGRIRRYALLSQLAAKSTSGG